MDNAQQRAFPISLDGHHIDGGLTKREIFAISAMQGLISACGNNGLVHFDDSSVARNAISIADELLKQLEQQL